MPINTKSVPTNHKAFPFSPAPTHSLSTIGKHLLGHLPPGEPTPVNGHPPAEAMVLLSGPPYPLPGGAPGLLVIRPMVEGGWSLFLVTPSGTYVYGEGNRRGHQPRVFHDRYNARETAMMLAACTAVRGPYLDALERFPQAQPGQAWQRWTSENETAFLEDWRGRVHDPANDVDGSTYDVSWLAQLVRRAKPVLQSVDPATAVSHAAVLLMIVASQRNRVPAFMLDEAWSLLERNHSDRR